MNNYISEKIIEDRMNSVIVPYLDARKQDAYIEAGGNVSLHCQTYTADDPRGTLLIVHGFTESIPKYRELVYYFLTDRLNVVIYENRCHGLSTRLVKNMGLVHVRRFEDYANDLDTVVNKVVSALPGPYFLYSHSMGGGISALYLERGGSFFKKAVLSSPMVEVKHMGLPLWLCKTVFGFFNLIGCGKKRVFVYPKERPAEDWNPNEDTSCERWSMNEMNKRLHPEYATYAPTYSWIYQGLKLPKKLLKKGAPEKIRTDVLLFIAELDHLVFPESQEKLIARVPGGKKVIVPKATHTLFYNTDSICLPYLEQVLDFVQ